MDKSAEQLFLEREKRINDAIELKVPDRVPIRFISGFFPAKYAGIPVRDFMYEKDKMIEASLQYMLDFEPDMIENPFGNKFLGEVMEVLDYQQMKWPGYNLDKDSSYQFIETEPMKSEDYEDFLFDPTDFVLRKLWPRIFGGLKGLEKLPPLNDVLCYNMGIGKLLSFGDPDVIEALERLTRAAKAVQNLQDGASAFAQKSKELGFPAQQGGGTQAPFDTLSDYLRSTQQAMMDLFRRPDKIMEATEKMLPIMINMGLAAKERGVPRVFIPLHKGLDGFMSIEQFKKFYWPTLKKLIEALVHAGIVPTLFWEGDVTSKLELIGDIPKGKAIYFFERTDIFKAKEVLGSQVCIEGNVSMTLLSTGNPDDVKSYCKKLIDVVGKDGGFIMNAATNLDDAKPANLKAMVDFTKDYGVYN